MPSSRIGKRTSKTYVIYMFTVAALFLVNVFLYQRCAPQDVVSVTIEANALPVLVSSGQGQANSKSSATTVNKELFEGVRRQWDHFGAEQPMWGVLTNDIYKDESNMTEEAVEQFWKGGQQHISRILQTKLPEFNLSIGNGVAIDFGSGVGRLSIPLSAYFERVYSVDISPNYLDVLMRNAKAFGVDTRIVPTLNDGDVTAVVREPTGVDFIVSLIAIQHNPPPVQRMIIKQLLSLLRPGGVAYLHIPFALGAGMRDRTDALMDQIKTEEAVGTMQMHFTPQVLIRYIAEEEANCNLVGVLKQKDTEDPMDFDSAVFIFQKKNM